MEQLEEGIRDYVRLKNKFESRETYTRQLCKTSNESTREEVGCGGNEDERIRGTTKVGEISKKVQESRLKWYGHVLRREDEYVGKRVMAMEVPRKRRRGRPKRMWLDSTRNDLSEREYCQGRIRKTWLNGGVS